MIEQAKQLAQRLQRHAADDPTRIRHAYDLLFAREPLAEELALAQSFLQQPAEAGLSTWEQFAQALLATNEMSYVD
jgi:hypothetical protein